MTASVLKEDQKTQKVEQNAFFNRTLPHTIQIFKECSVFEATNITKTSNDRNEGNNILVS